MKFTINIECTPEEARDFMGLKDPAELQQMMFKAMQEQMGSQLPEGMADQMGEQMQHWQNLQKMFWSQMATPFGTASDSEKGTK